MKSPTHSLCFNQKHTAKPVNYVYTLATSKRSYQLQVSKWIMGVCKFCSRSCHISEQCHTCWQAKAHKITKDAQVHLPWSKKASAYCLLRLSDKVFWSYKRQHWVYNCQEGPQLLFYHGHKPVYQLIILMLWEWRQFVWHKIVMSLIFSLKHLGYN